MSPTPTLTAVCEIVVELGTARHHGVTRDGLRRVTPILGGSIRGVAGSGAVALRAEILPGGGDRQLVRSDGAGGEVVEIDARYDARTASGALLTLHASGVRHVPAPGSADPVLFRVALRFETADPALAPLQNALHIADGVREADLVRHTVYRVG